MATSFRVVLYLNNHLPKHPGGEGFGDWAVGQLAV